MRNLPKKLFVEMEQDGTTSYPVAHFSVEEAICGNQETITLGVYALTDTVRVKPTFAILAEPRKKK